MADSPGTKALAQFRRDALVGAARTLNLHKWVPFLVKANLGGIVALAERFDGALNARARKDHLKEILKEITEANDSDLSALFSTEEGGLKALDTDGGRRTEPKPHAELAPLAAEPGRASACRRR